MHGGSSQDIGCILALGPGPPSEAARAAIAPFLGIGVMRQFIRHPADVPIEVSAGDPSDRAAHQASNVSLGGLAFRAARELAPGQVVEVRIHCVRPVFETRARVVWCRERDGGFDLGVQFLTAEDAFRARMVEQVCHIETYRKTVQETEGRLLTGKEAAMEWIARYAAEFPEPGAGETA
jgi:hypothetical protein